MGMNLTDEIRLEASKRGVYLFRNNSGACHTQDGRFIRFGLANDSKRINAVLKSGDLLGFTPVTITQEMVGKKVAIFTSVEIKKYKRELRANTPRAKAQRAWHDLVKNNGGMAIITYTLDSFLNELYIYKR